MKHVNPILFLAFTAGLADIDRLAEQYPLKIEAKRQGDKADIRIEGTIWDWKHEDFKYQVDGLLDDGIEDVNLYINSPGGDVFAANQIVNEMERFEGRVNGHGGALVASAASLIAISCDSFTMSENGQFMYHKPMASIRGNEDAVKSRLKLLKNITDQYRNRYAEKTGKTSKQIEKEWSKGDVWLTAKEALDEGFITGISDKKEKMSKESALMIAACGSPIKVSGSADAKKEDRSRIDPGMTSKTKTDDRMKNREAIIAKLKLAKDATDEQIEAALDVQLEKAQKTEQLEADAQKLNDTVIDTMLETALDVKKITADQKEKYKVLAQKDFDSTKSLIDSLNPVQKISAQLAGDGKDSGENRTKWSMQDYMDKDPEALDALAEEDPEKFNELMEAHYNSKNQ